jgi:hypothetical protein
MPEHLASNTDLEDTMITNVLFAVMMISFAIDHPLYQLSSKIKF